EASSDGKYVTDLVQKGDGREFELYLLDTAKNSWTRVASYDDQIKKVRFGRDDSLWLLSTKDATRGKLMRLSPATPALAQAKVVIPEGEAVIEGWVPA